MIDHFLLDTDYVDGDPYGKYNGNEMRYVAAALRTEGAAADIDWVGSFEQAFAKKVGSAHAIAVNSGTSGLHAALYGVGVGPGDEVIQPALTVVMDAYCTLHLGAIPVFADVDIRTWHISADTIEPLITPQTKAILTVSWQGLPVDVDPIMKIAKIHNIAVVDDSAQTLLGRYKDSISGANTDVGVFSFEEKKHMTTGSEGGMIVTSNAEIAVAARKFAGIGYRHLTPNAGRTSLAASTFQNPNYKRFDTVGLNYRMNRVSAAIGLAQLERAEHLVARRRACAGFFTEAIKGCSWILCQDADDGIEHTHYTFAVRYEGDEVHGMSWADFYARYVEIGGHGFYGNVAIPYLEPSLEGQVFGGRAYAENACPVAEDLQSRIMQFKTNYRDLGEAQKQAEILSDLIDQLGRN